jgi:hypothetical protein
MQIPFIINPMNCQAHRVDILILFYHFSTLVKKKMDQFFFWFSNNFFLVFFWFVFLIIFFSFLSFSNYLVFLLIPTSLISFIWS